MKVKRIRRILRIAALGCAMAVLGCDGGGGDGDGSSGRVAFINTSSETVHVMAAGDETFAPFSLQPGEENSVSPKTIHGDHVEFMWSPGSRVHADTTGLENAIVFVNRTA